jgi:chloramphenicol 3-O-phosphotransferase
MAAAMLILLVGPKGSGKSHIGRLIETHLGAPFVHVEPWWMAYHAECAAAGRKPTIAGGIEYVHPRIAAVLAAHRRIVVETTGASREILDGLLALVPEGARLVVRVRAPLEVCLARVASRDQANQIPMDADGIREVHVLSEALDIPADLELVNVGLSDEQLLAALAPLAGVS